MRVLDVPFGTRPTSDAMATLLSTLQHATAISKERQQGHWINVSARDWRALLGRRYASVIAAAVRAGYIEVNHRYSVGRFSKSYRLAEAYRTPRTTRYRLRRRARASTEQRITLEPHDVVGHRLVDHFGAFTVPRSVASPDTWGWFCARAIERREFYATRCQYGRFHSTFTALPKAIRETLTVDGHPVIESDVKNCQPLLVGLLAARRHHPLPPRANHTTTTPHHHPTPYTICGALFSDLEKYLELCGRGELYDFLLERCAGLTTFELYPLEVRHPHATNRPVNRNDVKRGFLTMLFADVATTVNHPLFRIMATEFPTVARYIQHSKRFEYQSLARQCQRVESSILVDSVAGQLAQRFPILTIHDSIVSLTSDADAVSSTIRDTFHLLGVEVSIQQGLSRT